MRQVTRRDVLVGGVTAGGLAVAGIALDACGRKANSYPQQGGGGPEQGPRTPAPGQAGQGILDTVDHVPLGGGRIYDAHEVVVTQPTAGAFKCFRSICTHAGCPVNRIADGIIDCPCHGSKFSIVDGSVRRGPARTPLEPRAITVDGDQIRLLD